MAFTSWDWEPPPKHAAVEGVEYIAQLVGVIVAMSFAGGMVMAMFVIDALLVYTAFSVPS